MPLNNLTTTPRAPIYELTAEQLPSCDNLAIKHLFDPKNPLPEQHPISTETSLFQLANLIQEVANINIDSPESVGFYVNDVQIKALPETSDDQISPVLRDDLNKRLSEDHVEQLLTFFDIEITEDHDVIISRNLFGLAIADVLTFGLQKMGLTNVFIVGFGRYEGDKREWHINNNKYKNKVTLTHKTAGFLVMINEGEKPEDEEYFKYFCHSIGYDPDPCKSETSGHWKIQKINCMAESETLLTDKGFKQHAYRTDTPAFIDAIRGQKYAAEPEKKPKAVVSWWNLAWDWIVSIWKLLTCCYQPVEKKLSTPSSMEKTITSKSHPMSTATIAMRANIATASLVDSQEDEATLRAALIPKAMTSGSLTAPNTEAAFEFKTHFRN